ncbi:MAG: hypothetical protein ACFFDW_04405 [Candidatus Thorarchaeota archaeon]
MMKKIFLSYLVITLTIITGLVVSTIVYDSIRSETYNANAQFVDNLKYTIYEDSMVDINGMQFDSLTLNQSHLIKDYISLEPRDEFQGGFLTAGSIENGTSDKHALLQLIEFDSVDIASNVAITDVYLNTTHLETQYISVSAVISSFDGVTDQNLIYSLQYVITDNVYVVDIFSIESAQINYVTNLIISPADYGTVLDIQVFDIDNDNICELYVIGENATHLDYYMMTEFSYNDTSLKYEPTQVFEWNVINQDVLKLATIVDTTMVNFILISINSTETNTIITAISIERNEIRKFALTDTLQLDFSANTFRAYGIKTFSIGTDEDIVLFGTYIQSTNNYPAICLISMDAGTFNEYSVSTLSGTPNWSLDGLIIDMDQDDNDEIILTTYDLSSNTNSLYGVFDGQTGNLITQQVAGINRIKLGTNLNLASLLLGSFVGLTATNNPHIIFHSMAFLPVVIKSNGQYLLFNQRNNLSLIPNDLLGNPVERDDFNILVTPEHSEIVDYISSSSNFSLEIQNNELVELTDITNFELISDQLTLANFDISLEIVQQPAIEITIPAEPILSREFDNKQPYLTIDIENLMAEILTFNVSAYQVESSLINHYSGTVDVYGSSSFLITFLAYESTPPSITSDEILITIETNAGTFTFDIPLEFKTGNQIIGSDLITITIVWVVIVVVILLVLMNFFYRRTKELLEKHISADEPLDLDLRWFENRALSKLVNEYRVAGNWEKGIKLCSEFKCKELNDFHKFRVREFLETGQRLAYESKFFDTLGNWDKARESLEVLGENEWLDTLDWVLEPLRKIVEIRRTMKGEQKAAALLKEFNALSGMRAQSKIILGVEISVPLYIVAEELGLAYKDAKDLQSSLTYLQFAYQYAPDNLKTRIVNEITSLIGLGVVPTELTMPIEQKLAQERLATRKIRCFNCGEERERNTEVCPNCGIALVTCSVCKLPISFGADTAQCQHCENIAHREHLLEWTKVKGSCPICQNQLKTDDVFNSGSTKDK